MWGLSKTLRITYRHLAEAMYVYEFLLSDLKLAMILCGFSESERSVFREMKTFQRERHDTVL